MKLVILLALTATWTVSALTVPYPSRTESYFLRVDAPSEPYHHRNLVLLQNSWRLGLENFTVHPPTLPVTFTPVHLPTGTFALRGTYDRNGNIETSYISALIAKDGSRPITIGLVFAPTPDEKTVANEPQACPDGYDCKADGWTGVDRGQLMFGEDGGTFEPIKESPEGWIVYWKGSGDETPNHPVKLEVVQTRGRGGYGY